MSPLDPRRVKAICFDIDGTLSDSDDVLVQRLTPWMRPWATLLRRDPARMARQVVMAAETPLNDLYEVTDRLGLDGFFFRLAHWWGQLWPHPPRRERLIPGVDTMLAALASRYPLAVVSARPREATDRFLRQFGLQWYFGECVASAETCPRTKPDPAPVRWAAACLGVEPEACLMVGDTTVDIRAGRAAGAQTVGVLCGFGEAQELQQAGADLILPSTADLIEWL